MKRNMRILALAMSSLMFCLSSCVKQEEVDVLIVGGGASGISAGIQSARMGVKAVVLEETPWVGGMLTSAGVSCIDGNYNLRSGIFGEFIDSLAVRYACSMAYASETTSMQSTFQAASCAALSASRSRHSASY